MKKLLVAATTVLFAANAMFAQTSSAMNVATAGQISDGVIESFGEGVDTEHGAVFAEIYEQKVSAGIGAYVADGVWLSVMDAVNVTGNDNVAVTVTQTSNNSDNGSVLNNGSTVSATTNGTDPFASTFNNTLKVGITFNKVGGQLFWTADNTQAAGFKAYADPTAGLLPGATPALGSLSAATASTGTTASTSSQTTVTGTTTTKSTVTVDPNTVKLTSAVNGADNNTWGIDLKNIKTPELLGDTALYLQLKTLKVSVNNGAAFKGNATGRTTDYKTKYSADTTTKTVTGTDTDTTAVATTEYSGEYFNGYVIPSATLEAGFSFKKVGVMTPKFVVEDTVDLGFANFTDTGAYKKVSSTTGKLAGTDVVSESTNELIYSKKYVSGSEFGFGNTAKPRLKFEFDGEDKFKFQAQLGADVYSASVNTPETVTTTAGKSFTKAKIGSATETTTTREYTTNSYNNSKSVVDVVSVTPTVEIGGYVNVTPRVAIAAGFSATPTSFKWVTTTTTANNGKDVVTTETTSSEVTTGGATNTVTQTTKNYTGLTYQETTTNGTTVKTWNGSTIEDKSTASNKTITKNTVYTNSNATLDAYLGLIVNPVENLSIGAAYKLNLSATDLWAVNFSNFTVSATYAF